MPYNNTLKQRHITILILIIGVAVSILIATQALAQTNLDDIAFPIAELGDCASENECRVYCDELGHLEECLAFAEAHNLLTSQELQRARALLEIGEGPGGCVSHDTCEVYCENINNIEECLAFAETHDVLSPDELEEARRVSSALQSGAVLPGGCTSRNTCEAYCEDLSNIDECLAFAEAAGFISPEEIEIARKVAPLLREGKTPGGCQSERECEAYCEDDAHLEECIDFGLELGFISTEDASIARRTGGRGPGNCRSREECEAFCNSPVNQEICFAFAREHGLIDENELGNIEHGIARLKEGVQHANPETLECLQGQLGFNIIKEIEAGMLLPGPEIGDRVRECFESTLVVDERITEALNNASPEIKRCFENRLGADVIVRLEAGDTSDLIKLGREIGDVIRGCFEEFEFPEGDFDQQGTPGVGGVLPSFPPEIEECLSSAFGGDFKERLSSGTLSGAQVRAQVKSCVRREVIREQLDTDDIRDIREEFGDIVPLPSPSDFAPSDEELLFPSDFVAPEDDVESFVPVDAEGFERFVPDEPTEDTLIRTQSRTGRFLANVISFFQRVFDR